jgi:hypothetical protein
MVNRWRFMNSKYSVTINNQLTYFQAHCGCATIILSLFRGAAGLLIYTIDPLKNAHRTR